MRKGKSAALGIGILVLGAGAGFGVTELTHPRTATTADAAAVTATTAAPPDTAPPSSPEQASASQMAAPSGHAYCDSSSGACIKPTEGEYLALIGACGIARGLTGSEPLDANALHRILVQVQPYATNVFNGPAASINSLVTTALTSPAEYYDTLYRQPVNPVVNICTQWGIVTG